MKTQVFKDRHLLILILIITGVAVALVFLERSIPYLRGSVSKELDQEQPFGKTVCVCARSKTSIRKGGIMCVCVCVCVCETEREREREFFVYCTINSESQ